MVDKIITYNLAVNSSSSEVFYKEIHSSATKFLNKLKKLLNEELKDYQSFIDRSELEEVRSIEEYGIEIVLFAISYSWYLNEIREESGKIEYYYMDQAYEYFSKSNEFREEAIRFKYIINYFNNIDVDKKIIFLNNVFEIVNEVHSIGKRYLDKYIPKVDKFIKEYKFLKGKRDDLDLLLRDKDSYYINMLGADILNRVYEKEFRNAKEVYVFLPGCMTKMGSQCCAGKEKDGFNCKHCSKECKVSKITYKCSKYNVKVRILYHESEMNNKSVDESLKIGVVGVSCVLNLLSGGFKAKRLGYIPQCVFLDYCGCIQHWSKNGIVTEINEKQLYKTLKLK